MAWRNVTCPECEAMVGLGQAQKHCECLNCGAKFVVEWFDSQPPRLTGFGAAIAQGADGVPPQVAEERVNALDAMVAQAEAAVEAKHAQLEKARVAHRARQTEVQEVVAPAQNWTYLTGLVAAVAFFLVWFVLEGVGWQVALSVGVVFVVLSWAFHSRWLGAESWARGELHELRRRIEDAEAELSDAYLQLEDRVLERELTQRIAAHARSNRE